MDNNKWIKISQEELFKGFELNVSDDEAEAILIAMYGQTLKVEV